MNEPRQGNKSKEEVEILSQAFQAFNEATQQLQDSYNNLKERVKKLDLELADKNRALENNLKEKEEVKNYLHNILESLTTGVIVVDVEGHITTFNKTAGAITGKAPDACLGRPLKTVFSHDLFENMIQRLGKTGSGPLSLERDIPGKGDRQVHVRASASFVKDPDETPIGTVLIVQDLSEVRRLEFEAQRNQRLRAMGEMAAGIAHEIRNPLGGIELFASLLKKDLEHDAEKKHLVEHIQSGVKNMDRIISALLLFAKSPRPSRQKCNAKELIENLLDDTSALTVPENVRITSSFDPDNLVVCGDKELLKQVFVNLIRNGIQAMPKGGELKLATQKGTAPGPGKDHRQFITLTVSDSGGGIPTDHLMKIFNPFFTTKEKGTGLGLSISHNIIKAHQGTIDADSEEGRGTTFTVKLPSWDDELDEN